MQAKGRAFKYGDNVDTDVFIPAQMCIRDRSKSTE